MNNEKLAKIIQDAAKNEGYTGVMNLADAVREATGLSTERTRKVWKGLFEAKVGDYIIVMAFLEREFIKQ